MNSSVVLEDFESYVLCQYSGPLDVEGLSETFLEMGRFCARYRRHRALLDITLSKGEISLVDRFELAKDVASYWPSHAHLAVLARPDQSRTDRFFQTALRNLGIHICGFLEREAAIAWLNDGST